MKKRISNGSSCQLFTVLLSPPFLFFTLTNNFGLAFDILILYVKWSDFLQLQLQLADMSEMSENLQEKSGAIREELEGS